MLIFPRTPHVVTPQPLPEPQARPQPPPHPQPPLLQNTTDTPGSPTDISLPTTPSFVDSSTVQRSDQSSYPYTTSPSSSADTDTRNTPQHTLRRSNRIRSRPSWMKDYIPS